MKSLARISHLAAATLIMAGVLVLTPGCQKQPSDSQRLLLDVANRAILPAHQRLVDSTRQLYESARRFCKQPSSEGHAALQQNWKSAMTDWQALRVVQFGPILVDNQHWKIQFWPDRHNLIGKKLNDLLRSEEPINPQRIAEASAAIQGLSALEYLLFDESGGTLDYYLQTAAQADRRCQVLQHVAEHSQRVASDLLAAWRPEQGNYVDRFVHAGADNPAFATDKDALRAILDSLLASIELLKNDKLGGPLGHNSKHSIPQPYQSEAWRSGYSLQLAQASLRGVMTIYYAGSIQPSDTGFGLDDYLRSISSGALAASIDQQFKAADQSFPPQLNLFNAVSDAQQAAQLETCYRALTVLARTFKYEVPAAFEITLGFNANDGD